MIPQCQQDMLLCAPVGFSSTLCKRPGGVGLTHFLPLQNQHRLPQGTSCPSEVVRDHTRDKLGKDKGEIPQPLYLFVSLSAIFTYVVVYKVLHDTWSYWLCSLGESSRALEQWCTLVLLLIWAGSCLCLHSPFGFSLALTSIPQSW